MVDTKPTSEVVYTAPFASMQKPIPELDNMYFSNDYLHVLVASHKGTTIFDIHFHTVQNCSYRNRLQQAQKKRPRVGNGYSPIIMMLLDLGFHVVDGVAWFNLQGLASQGLHEDLHTTTQTENKMESQLLLGTTTYPSFIK
ncbi:hypothetical protein EMCRGX_G024409 [Ephydatia muelleri]